MKTDRLFQLLAAIHPVSYAFRAAVEKELINFSYPKNYLLLEPPKIASYAYFLNNGFAESYLYVDSQKKVIRFWEAGHVIVSTKSFLDQTPSSEFIRLLQDSELLCLSYASINNLFQNFPESHIITRTLLSQYLEYSNERTYDMQHLSSIARYKKLRQQFPSIEQYASQEDIASYLGITPQSLSRVKRKDSRS